MDRPSWIARDPSDANAAMFLRSIPLPRGGASVAGRGAMATQSTLVDPFELAARAPHEAGAMRAPMPTMSIDVAFEWEREDAAARDEHEAIRAAKTVETAAVSFVEPAIPHEHLLRARLWAHED
jgi:hypothetical protein